MTLSRVGAQVEGGCPRFFNVKMKGSGHREANGGSVKYFGLTGIQPHIFLAILGLPEREGDIGIALYDLFP